MRNPLLLLLLTIASLQSAKHIKTCVGLDDQEQFKAVRCGYNGMKCRCSNKYNKYPTCICSPIGFDTPSPSVQLSTPPNPTTADYNPIQENIVQVEPGWDPIHVIGIGSSVLLTVLLTSLACCCACRQCNKTRVENIVIKPPEYSDSPPPPYHFINPRDASSSSEIVHLPPENTPNNNHGGGNLNIFEIRLADHQSEYPSTSSHDGVYSSNGRSNDRSQPPPRGVTLHRQWDIPGLVDM